MAGYRREQPAGVARPDLSGILNVHKPVGPTSHDVVAMIRRWAGVRRVGHAGTLDPLAEGVLLVCLGRATRVAKFLMLGTKRYRAEITLGISTDTYDSEGVFSSPSPPESIPETAESIGRALVKFVGQIDQAPPRYSALKRGGQPLYKRARKGENVVVQPRPVVIEEIAIISWQRPRLVVEVTCGPGTYIRSLAHDLGVALGCGAHLSALTRLASGQFTIEAAVPLEVLREAFRAADVAPYLQPLDAALSDLPRLVFGTDDSRRLVRGQAIAGSMVRQSPAADANAGEPGLWRAYGPRGQFLALVAFDAERRRWLPRKVFADPS